MLDGIPRKIAFVIMFLSSIGWVVFCVGFGIRNEWLSNNEGKNVVHISYFCHWCLAVSALALYLTSFIHVLYGNKCTAVVSFVLVPVFFVSAGGVLQLDGDYLYKYHHGRKEEYVDHVPIEFAGAVAAAGLYWLVLMLWGCFSDPKKKLPYQPIND